MHLFASLQQSSDVKFSSASIDVGLSKAGTNRDFTKFLNLIGNFKC